jgi:hypothetical protein
MEKFPNNSQKSEQIAESTIFERLGMQKWPEGSERHPRMRILSIDLSTTEGGGRGINIPIAMLQVPEGFDMTRVRREFLDDTGYDEEYHSNEFTFAECFREWLVQKGIAREITVDHYVA